MTTTIICTRTHQNISRREFLKAAHCGLGLSASRLIVGGSRSRGRRTKGPKRSSCSGRKASGTSSGSRSGGGADGKGSSDSGGSDGDDDGGHTLGTFLIFAEWWRVSILIGSILTIIAFVVLWSYSADSRIYPPVLLLTFVGASGLTLYLNPQLWFRRMAEICIAGLLGSSSLSGLSLGLMLPNVDCVVWMTIPSPHWSTKWLLGLLAAFFAMVHYIKSERSLRRIQIQ